VALSAGARVSLGSLSVTEIGALCVELERPDDQILACRLDDLFGDQPQFVDLQDGLARITGSACGKGTFVEQ